MAKILQQVALTTLESTSQIRPILMCGMVMVIIVIMHCHTIISCHPAACCDWPCYAHLPLQRDRPSGQSSVPPLALGRDPSPERGALLTAPRGTGGRRRQDTTGQQQATLLIGTVLDILHHGLILSLVANLVKYGLSRRLVFFVELVSLDIWWL